MALQELQIYGLWAAKQTAKGTANSAPAHRFKQTGGNFTFPRDDGSVAYSDATPVPDQQDWVNTLVGNGAPVTLATPEELSWLLWAFEGGETTAAVTGPPVKTTHTTKPLPGLGHVCTFVTRKGSSAVERYEHADCYISALELGGSTADKAVRATPTVFSLDPGKTRAADPAQAMPTKGTFLYTDGTSRFTIDGTAFRGHSEFTLSLTKDLNPVYGDDTTVYDFAIGNTTITIGVSLYFDADGQAQFNRIVYGSATPVAGTKPLKTIPALGSYAFDLRARDAAGVVNGDKFILTLAGVKWTPPASPDPNAAGGTPTMALSGTTRKSGSLDQYKIDIDSDAAAFTV